MSQHIQIKKNTKQVVMKFSKKELTIDESLNLLLDLDKPTIENKELSLSIKNQLLSLPEQKVKDIGVFLNGFYQSNSYQNKTLLSSLLNKNNILTKIPNKAKAHLELKTLIEPIKDTAIQIKKMINVVVVDGNNTKVIASIPVFLIKFDIYDIVEVYVNNSLLYLNTWFSKMLSNKKMDIIISKNNFKIETKKHYQAINDYFQLGIAAFDSDKKRVTKDVSVVNNDDLNNNNGDYAHQIINYLNDCNNNDINKINHLFSICYLLSGVKSTSNKPFHDLIDTKSFMNGLNTPLFLENHIEQKTKQKCKKERIYSHAMASLINDLSISQFNCMIQPVQKTVAESKQTINVFFELQVKSEQIVSILKNKWRHFSQFLKIKDKECYDFIIQNEKDFCNPTLQFEFSFILHKKQYGYFVNFEPTSQKCDLGYDYDSFINTIMTANVIDKFITYKKSDIVENGINHQKHDAYPLYPLKILGHIMKYNLLYNKKLFLEKIEKLISVNNKKCQNDLLNNQINNLQDKNIVRLLNLILNQKTTQCVIDGVNCDLTWQMEKELYSYLYHLLINKNINVFLFLNKYIDIQYCEKDNSFKLHIDNSKDFLNEITNGINLGLGGGYNHFTIKPFIKRFEFLILNQKINLNTKSIQNKESILPYLTLGLYSLSFCISLATVLVWSFNMMNWITT